MPKILSSETRDREYRPRMVKASSFFISEGAVNDIANHADMGLAEEKEVMGLMMGSIFYDDLGEYAVVRDVVTSKLDADDVSVRFDPEGLEDLFGSIDSSKGEEIVGWYHSHPGYGCYLSETDVKTHKGIFGSDTGFAMVVDPTESTIVVFVCNDDGYEKTSMIVLESE